jgi:hypothetical protein
MKSIEDLPNDVLFHLFRNFLDFNSKLSAELVCKRWHEIGNLSFDSKKTLIIADYEIYESRIKTLNLKRNISLVKMVSFHLIERSEKKDKKFISIILRKYKNLENLCICLKFTKCNKLLDLVSQFCPKTIQYLRIELSDCSVNNRTLIISQEEVIQLSEKIPELKYFYIDFGILFINEISLQTIFTKWTKLESFIMHTPCFRGRVYNSELGNTLSTEFIGEHFGLINNRLVKLEMPGNILNNYAITKIPENILKRLLLFKLNINSIELICRKFSSLIYFGFSIEININEDDMYFLMENVGKLQNLKELYFAIFSGVAVNYNCVKFLRKCNQLIHLQIDQTLMSRDSIDAITRYLPQIQSLEIWTSGFNQNFHHYLTDNTISNIRHLKQLRKLNFRGQRNISDSSIAHIICALEAIVQIDVRTTKASIITLKVCIHRSLQSDQTIELFIHETPISKLFNNYQLKRIEICRHLVLSNEEYDYKIQF